MSGALSRLRSDAQALHVSVHITTIRDHAAIRLHLQDVGERAWVLSEDIKVAIDARTVGADRRLPDAVSLLIAVAHQSANLACSSKSDLNEVTHSLRAKMNTAVRVLSHALAAERCTNELAELRLTPTASRTRAIFASLLYSKPIRRPT